MCPPKRLIDWETLSFQRIERLTDSFANLRLIGDNYNCRGRHDWLRRLRNSLDNFAYGEMRNFDIFRHNVGQLLTFDWLPCYGCIRIKRITTDFYRDQTAIQHGFLGSMALQRCCIECSIDAPTPWIDAPPRFENPFLYLQAMPRGYPGLRLRCSACCSVQWIKQRPIRRQRDKRLCDGCYAKVKAEAKISTGQMFWQEWSRLAGIQATMPVDQEKSSNAWTSSKRDVWNEEQREMPHRIQNRVEMLRIEGGDDDDDDDSDV